MLYYYNSNIALKVYTMAGKWAHHTA